MSLVAELEMKDRVPAEPRRGRRRPLPDKVKNIVWGRAAGRCQYAGCNALLIGDEVSGAVNANAAYIGHIIADSEDGPRGDPIQSPKLAQEPDNLMLVCDRHHRVFDREMVAEHPADLLMAMKRRHEDRIRTVTAIDEDMSSHVIRYAAKIGTNESPVAKGDLKWSMIPDRYPLDDGWIDLDLATLDLSDHEPDFWRIQIRNLRAGFAEKVRGRMERQEIRRLTVFGLAPIPLLIELGRLISDIATADVRQLLRSPKGWRWDPNAPPLKFNVLRPSGLAGKVALKLAVSAPVVDDRIHAVLGNDAAIWSITADGAHNDIMRSQADLAEFARLFRTTLDAIKIAHGENTMVHVFPAVPISAAVEAGRAWQPKAHPALKIYDQNKKLGGFIFAHELGHAS
ncbi:MULTISPECIES: SAVED domain-containing protein [unclassified Mesorhizobium]|uniref:SAVED domain-containing protein n=1 Tax=unclassified Mesorhizobium TaxID=325217 RepID=UPI0033391AC9